MTRSLYTIRRVVDGYCHFARVAVTLSLSGEPEVPPSVYVSPDWISASKSGVQYALDVMESNNEVTVVQLQGTLSDTREDTLFVVSAIATFRLLGLTEYVEEYDGSAWKVGKA